MLSFFVITARRLVKEKFYALVCVLSLSLGIASSLLISLYLLSELTYDEYHENHDRIHRIVTHIGPISAAFAGYETAPILVRDNPQFLDYIRFIDATEKRFNYGDNENTWDKVFLTDPSAFKHFTFVPKYGELDGALADPYSIAISESFAEFYFGDRDPIGELLSTERFEFRVTLVYEDPPYNVSQKYDALIPATLLEVYQPDYQDNFGDRYLAGNGTSYLYVANDFDPDSMTAAASYFFDTYIAEDIGTLGDLGSYTLTTQKLSEIRFGPDLLLDDTGGNIVNLYLFAAMAIALLAISTINYANLATARAAVRVREVAMKKILGASRQALVLQFLGESLLFVSLAVVFGLLLAAAALQLPTTQAFVGYSELSSIFSSPSNLLYFLLALIVVAMISGLYPAIHLARQSALSAFRPAGHSGRLGLTIRQALVLMQMTASVIIVACVFIMLRQADFLSNSSMGFKKDNQLVVSLQGADAIRARAALLNELEQHNSVLSAVEITRALGRGLNISILPVENNNGVTENVTMNAFSVGDGFLETMEMELLTGNTFRVEQTDNEINPILVNETFVKQMEWDQPLGKRIGRSEVIGVVADFHSLSLHEAIDPAIISLYNDGYLDGLPEITRNRTSIDLIISVTGENMADTRSYIEQTIRRFSIQSVVDIRTLDDIWQEMYEDDTQAINLLGLFSGVSILISLLGLAGLAAYSTQQRGKEVAIRKVLGASVLNVLTLLSLNMFTTIAFSVIPAAVATFYLSNVWLERFAYRAEFSAVPYLSAIVIIGLVSAIVLVIQTLRTAQANPVLMLKYE